MEKSIIILLIGQVKDHLESLPVKDRVREAIYNHFLPQCNQFGLTEDDFYKLVLKPAYREAAPAPEEDPDPPNVKGTAIRLFGTTIHSLKRLGEVLFEDENREKIYLEDSTLLKAHVDQLADADTAISFGQLYNQEQDAEKRYLRICYRLNPGLGYRINKVVYSDLRGLIEAAFSDRALMDWLFAEFEKGKLHIWLHAREPTMYPAVPDQKKATGFLTFIYGVNGQFPFVIGDELFYSPTELTAKAQRDLNVWGRILTLCASGHLFIWFAAQGHPNWRTEFQQLAKVLQWKSPGDDIQKDYELMQKLLFIINPEATRPELTLSESKVTLLNLPATEPVTVTIEVKLKTRGYVTAGINLDPKLPGVELIDTHLVLFDLTGQEQAPLRLTVNPQLLQKNTAHQILLQVVTAYERISVPVSIKAIFPVRAYLVYLLKYAAFGAGIFGLVRWLISTGRGVSDGLKPAVINQQIGRSLPDNWPLYYWTFTLLLASLTGAYVWIRKAEKV